MSPVFWWVYQISENTWWKFARVTEGHVQVLPCIHSRYRIVKKLGDLQYTLSAAPCVVVMVTSASTTVLVMVGSARTTVWVATRVISQLGLWRLTGSGHWRSYKTVKLEERRLCSCIHPSSSLINSTHRVESWCLAETGDLLCEGAKQQSAVTFAGPKGRGSQCRRYSWWRVEVQCVVHTSSCWWKDISHKVRPCIIVIGLIWCS